MATDTYSDGTTTYEMRTLERDRAETGYRSVGEQIFLWVAWTAAFAFWAFSMSTFFGILDAIAASPPGGLMGGMDAGGAGFLLMTVVGVAALGLIIAYGAVRWATRDKSLDPVTEASTAALYDAEERVPHRPA
jgi:hypothetical protein